jgi:hypothetical protein
MHEKASEANGCLGASFSGLDAMSGRPYRSPRIERVALECAVRGDQGSVFADGFNLRRPIIGPGDGPVNKPKGS